MSENGAGGEEGGRPISSSGVGGGGEDPTSGDRARFVNRLRTGDDYDQRLNTQVNIIQFYIPCQLLEGRVALDKVTQ